MANRTYGSRAKNSRHLRVSPNASAAKTKPKTADSDVSDRPARKLIDARGSIDSRAFNEEQRITSSSRDKHSERDSVIDLNSSRRHWRSRSGKRAATSSRVKPTANKMMYGAKYLRLSGGSPNKFGGYTTSGKPTSAKSSSIPVVVIISAIALLALVVITLWLK